MSALRKSLKHPETYLGFFALLGVLVCLDSFRSPPNQLSARAYVAAVHSYQHFSSKGVLDRYVRCRYIPTCSHYSEEAVQRYGIRKGLELTASRLWHCRTSVPLGTPDPVR